MPSSLCFQLTSVVAIVWLLFMSGAPVKADRVNVFDASVQVRETGPDWDLATGLDLSSGPLVVPDGARYTGPAVFGALHRNSQGSWNVATQEGAGMRVRFDNGGAGHAVAGLFLVKVSAQFISKNNQDYMEVYVFSSQIEHLKSASVRFVIGEEGKFFISESSPGFAADGPTFGNRERDAFSIQALQADWFDYDPSQPEGVSEVGGPATPAFGAIGYVGFVVFAESKEEDGQPAINFGVRYFLVVALSLIVEQVEDGSTSPPSPMPQAPIEETPEPTPEPPAPSPMPQAPIEETPEPTLEQPAPSPTRRPTAQSNTRSPTGPPSRSATTSPSNSPSAEPSALFEPTISQAPPSALGRPVVSQTVEPISQGDVSANSVGSKAQGGDSAYSVRLIVGLCVVSAVGAAAMALLAALVFARLRIRKALSENGDGHPLSGRGAYDNYGYYRPEIGLDMEVSTLGDPIPYDAGPRQSEASTLGSSGLDYDYKKAYAKSEENGTLTSTKSVESSLARAEAATASISIDDPSLEKVFKSNGEFGVLYESEEQYEVMAPPGLLGFAVQPDREDGRSAVSAIKPTSVLATIVKVGDRLVSVDDEDVTMMRSSHVSHLIAQKQNNDVRKLVFSRRMNQVNSKE